MMFGTCLYYELAATGAAYPRQGIARLEPISMRLLYYTGFSAICQAKNAGLPYKFRQPPRKKL